MNIPLALAGSLASPSGEKIKNPVPDIVSLVHRKQTLGLTCYGAL